MVLFGESLARETSEIRGEISASGPILVFSETAGLTPAEKLLVVTKLKRSIADVEAVTQLDLGNTQVVIAGEMYEQGEGEPLPPLTGTTHALTISYEDVAIRIQTAFAEYGSLSTTMDAVYVLRAAVSRYAKRRKIGVSGFVRVSLVATESDRSHDRFEIAFHGSVRLDAISEHQFVEPLAQYLMIRANQVVLLKSSYLLATGSGVA